jgi:hypothetical protein
VAVQMYRDNRRLLETVSESTIRGLCNEVRDPRLYVAGG